MRASAGQGVNLQNSSIPETFVRTTAVFGLMVLWVRDRANLMKRGRLQRRSAYLGCKFLNSLSKSDIHARNSRESHHESLRSPSIN